MGIVTLRIRREVLDQIIFHSRRTYPEECCGLLVAHVGEKRDVVEAVEMRNSFPGPRQKRYSIDPMELYRVDKSISEQGGLIVGIYHSHPDHPPTLSSYDLKRAWPWFSYLVVSVSRGEFNEVKSWTLADDRTAFTEPIEVASSL